MDGPQSDTDPLGSAWTRAVGDESIAFTNHAARGRAGCFALLRRGSTFRTRWVLARSAPGRSGACLPRPERRATRRLGGGWRIGRTAPPTPSGVTSSPAPAPGAEVVPPSGSTPRRRRLGRFDRRRGVQGGGRRTRPHGRRCGDRGGRHRRPDVSWSGSRRTSRSPTRSASASQAPADPWCRGTTSPRGRQSSGSTAASSRCSRSRSGRPRSPVRRRSGSTRCCCRTPSTWLATTPASGRSPSPRRGASSLGTRASWSRPTSRQRGQGMVVGQLRVRGTQQ